MVPGGMDPSFSCCAWLGGSYSLPFWMAQWSCYVLLVVVHDRWPLLSTLDGPAGCVDDEVAVSSSSSGGRSVERREQNRFHPHTMDRTSPDKEVRIQFLNTELPTQVGTPILRVPGR